LQELSGVRVMVAVPWQLFASVTVTWKVKVEIPAGTVATGFGKVTLLNETPAVVELQT
jgi:hypothetical protein